MGDATDIYPAGAEAQPDYDVLIIGGGLSGIRSLISMKDIGLRAKVFERGSDAGGVWYWNRYPGARFDSESYTYTFTFSQEILDEWEWKEHFSAQPDTLRYVQYLLEKFKLRPDFQFSTEIKTARWQQDSGTWALTDQHGTTYTSRFLINALGPLTTPTLPDIPGVEDFKGIAYHTSRWPHEPVHFEGKRVGVIGTGATGVQAIQEVAKTAKATVVLQRTANWTVPMRNQDISPEELQTIRKKLPDILQKCKTSPFGFMYKPDPRKTMEVSKEEREEFWNYLYDQRGLIKWVGNFSDLYLDQEANDEYSAWMARKIRERIDDPAIAEKLVPKHGFGLRRVPLENGYYELFNRPDVELVDLQETPILKITETGVQTSAKHVDLDVLIYATGFDALTGSFEEIDYYGENCLTLKEKWADGPQTFLGMTVRGFPNMFNVLGPHQATGNMTHVIEYAVQWITRFIQYLKKHNFTYANPDEEGETWWTEHVLKLTEGLLSMKVDSWMTGYISNKADKRRRRIIRYFGSNVEFRERCNKVADNGYKQFTLA
jgi:cation diffusion facilitator CzcD-associated flavoprotein CzcO